MGATAHLELIAAFAEMRSDEPPGRLATSAPFLPYEASATVRQIARLTESLSSNQRFTFGAPSRLTPAASCRQSQP
jgi:hypothetical protein